ncbi:HPr family phosphocarrier protein [Vulgatibacter incomptus]|uniref:Phosphocarrier protein of PTS system n=1 Tax=Vulgatibacter incomptus TaxID=1391653 RepID=A0A0K1PGK1_9BACT|nr:HPr family phosphocarrier protein [Vulgatibacter incomptus]AKU92224.1 Phosphocarrier protein of PTS system [Vulgatibacter incomptus]
MEALERTFTIVNRLGLHARAAARLVQTANRFQSEISVSRNGQNANAKSIMGVLMLAAAQGSTVAVRTDGADGAEAMEAIGALIESGFGEDTG